MIILLLAVMDAIAITAAAVAWHYAIETYRLTERKHRLSKRS